MNCAPQACSPAEAARRLNVSVSTIHNWVDAGHLTAWKTPGGHRKVTLDSLNRLISAVQPKPVLHEGKRLVLVVVEDEADLRDIYRGHIERWGLPITLHLAGDGCEGLMLAGLHRPDLLITDLLMPGVGGLDMVKAMRSCPETALTPIVVVSGMSGEDVLQGELPSDIRVFGKPIPFEQLRGIAEEILKGKE